MTTAQRQAQTASFGCAILKHFHTGEMSEVVVINFASTKGKSETLEARVAVLNGYFISFHPPFLFRLSFTLHIIFSVSLTLERRQCLTTIASIRQLYVYLPDGPVKH